MNLKDLLSAPLQQFIRDHENDDPHELVLKHKEILGVDSSFVADQIKGRKKAKEKLPDYFASADVIFPPSVNLEQSSSQETANYKKDFLQQHLSNLSSCADLTGGFGVDSYYLSKVFDAVVYVEKHKAVLELAEHNHKALGATNLTYKNQSAEEFLNAAESSFDLLYIDPSRRVEGNRKVLSLKESEPDVIAILDLLLTKSASVLVKASPMIDIQLAVSELKTVRTVVVVSVHNECKELLFFLDKTFSGEPTIETVDFSTKHPVSKFNFLFSEEKNLTVNFSAPKKFLYEPNAAILKAGAFKSIARQYNISKLHPSTHFYTAETLLPDFPGRIFKLISAIKPDRKAVKEALQQEKANIITRNYPLGADELRKKLHLKEGGEKFVIGFSGQDKKHLFTAERVR